MSEVLEEMLQEVRTLRHKHYRWRNVNNPIDAEKAIGCLREIIRTAKLMQDEITHEKRTVSKHMQTLDKLLNIDGKRKRKPYGKPDKIKEEV